MVEEVINVRVLVERLAACGEGDLQVLALVFYYSEEVVVVPWGFTPVGVCEVLMKIFP
jgi:hypothetical protein